MPCIRPFLAVAQTTLTDPDTKERYPFDGLFAGRNIPAGGFLGFYNGNFKDGTYRGKGAYTFQLSDMYVMPKPDRRTGTVSSAEYPLAMCNEPPPGTTANVVQRELSTARHVIPQLPAKTGIAALGFYVCRDIRAGEELFLHYGTRYNRNHYKAHSNGEVVGAAGKIKVQFMELPTLMMEHFGLQPYVPPDCFREYE